MAILTGQSWGILKSWLVWACSRLRDSRVRRTEKARTRKWLSLTPHPYYLRAWNRLDSSPVVSHNLWHAGCDDEKEESALCAHRACYELRRLRTSQTQILVRKGGSQHGLNRRFSFLCGTGYNDLSTYHFPQYSKTLGKKFPRSVETKAKRFQMLREMIIWHCYILRVSSNVNVFRHSIFICTSRGSTVRKMGLHNTWAWHSFKIN